MWIAAEDALLLRFFNVGDGDSALLEMRGQRPYRMLVDAGSCQREALAGGRACAEYLEALGVKRLDAVWITHLHLDHLGGLLEIVKRMPIGRVYSGYFPSADASPIPQEPGAEKTVRGLIDCLNAWRDTVRFLRQQGCALEEICASREISAPGGLNILCTAPDAPGMERQKRAWNRMFHGEPVSAEEKAAVSRLRNPASLILRAEYGGRAAVLGADVYGECWSAWQNAPCDLLKVPHHGDRKAMTQALADALRPTHAVISCGADYIPRKDRPSRDTADMLRSVGARVWYTGAYAGDALSPARRWPWIAFQIEKNGRLSGLLTEDLMGKLEGFG